MNKSKLVTIVLILALILAIFAGCQAQNAEIPTEPLPSSQPTKPTEPSSEPTEPSDDVTDPTETVCPRTVESFKARLTPYMTYREAVALWGPKDGDWSDSPDWNESLWLLEDNYFVFVQFFPTVHDRMDEYLATIPTDETKPDGTPLEFGDYFREWNYHMEAYKAVLYKGTPTGKREKVETWFDYGRGPFWQEEE